MPTRRALLAGSAAASLTGLAPMIPGATEGLPDPIHTLHAQWLDARAAWDAATEVRWALEQRLTTKRGFSGARVQCGFYNKDGQERPLYANTESQLRSMIEPNGHPGRQALLDRRLAELKASQAEWDALSATSGLDELSRIEDAAIEREESLWQMIAATPATTVAGSILKIELAATYCGLQGDLADPDTGRDLEWRLISSAVRDLRQLNLSQ